MKTLRATFLVAALATVAAGCFPENEPVAPYDRGSVRTATVEMGPSYGVRVYYDLGTSSVVRAPLLRHPPSIGSRRTSLGGGASHGSSTSSNRPKS